MTFRAFSHVIPLSSGYFVLPVIEHSIADEAELLADVNVNAIEET